MFIPDQDQSISGEQIVKVVIGRRNCCALTYANSLAIVAKNKLRKFYISERNLIIQECRFLLLN